MLKFFILILIGSFFSNSTWAKDKTHPSPSEKVCKTSLQGWTACFHPGYGPRKYEVVYFFHGVLGSEETWENSKYYAEIRNKWNTQASSPSVISISFGRFWLLTPKSSAPGSGLIDHLKTSDLIDFEIESLGQNRIQRRWGLGDSMGGHNILQFHARNPGFFKKIYALCPAQFMGSPFISLQESYRRAKKWGGHPAYVASASKLMGHYYDIDTWETESLFHLPKKFFKNLKSVTLVNVINDPYVFDKANSQWSSLATQMGAKINSQTLHGSHCYPVPISSWFVD